MKKHEYICNITDVVAQKATCLKRKVGTVIINDEYEIIATGYNGAPKGLPSCLDESECLLNNQGKCIRCAHSEMNAIAQAAKRGTALKGGIMYITEAPCVNCAAIIINTGIVEVRYKHAKNLAGGLLLQRAGVKVFSWNLEL